MSSKPHSKADQVVEKALASPPPANSPMEKDLSSWDRWFEGEGVSDDFMENRDQPSEPRPER